MKKQQEYQANSNSDGENQRQDSRQNKQSQIFYNQNNRQMFIFLILMTADQNLNRTKELYYNIFFKFYINTIKQSYTLEFSSLDFFIPLILFQFLLYLYFYHLSFISIIFFKFVMLFNRPNKILKIQPLHTYFIQWNPETKVNLQITLIKGTAEILGQQLMILSKVQIPPTATVIIYTWEGCQIQYCSSVQLINDIGTDITNQNHNNRETPMQFYMNLHYNLTKQRRLALQNNVFGPRIMVIGQQKNQKSDIIKLLTNYATKINMQPIYIDLDLQNSIFCDGCIGAAHIKIKFPKNFIQYDNKIAFFYGSTKIHKKTYFTLMQALSKSTFAKMNKQIKMNKQKGLSQQYPNFCSGLIINVPYLKKLPNTLQKQIIQEIIKQFDITHALIIQDMSTNAYLIKQFQKIERFSAPKLLQGIKSQNTKSNNKIEIYFNGGSPHLGVIFRRQIRLELSAVNIYELKISIQQKPYCVRLNLNQMQIVKQYITILHSKNDINDQYMLGHKVLTSPICCLAKIHSIQNGQLILHVTNEQFLQLYKHNLWVYGSLSDK